jgi:hypothetical protein
MLVLTISKKIKNIRNYADKKLHLSRIFLKFLVSKGKVIKNGQKELEKHKNNKLNSAQYTLYK